MSDSPHQDWLCTSGTATGIAFATYRIVFENSMAQRKPIGHAMNSIELRIAYFTHTFPGYTSTFIAEEILAMREMGANVEILAAHIPAEIDIPPEFGSFAEETRSIFPLHLGVLIAEHGRALLTRPRKYLSSLWIALTAGRGLSSRDRLRTIVHWLEAPLLYRLCRESGVHHVHVHFLNSPTSVMFFVNKLYGLTYSITAHGSDIFVEKILQIEKLSAALFTRVMTKFNLDALRSLGSNSQSDKPELVLIPIGIEMSEAPVRHPSRNGFTFLHVGRMVWQKGHKLLLEACQILKQSGRDLSLVMIGDGELRPQVARWIADMQLGDTVKLLGALPKSRVIDFYRTCDCFVLSSLSEGSPAVLVEAMSEGLPVIAPALHGIPEMLTSGQEGWLFETGEVDSLVAAMDEAMRDPNMLRTMGALAERHARQCFDLRANTRRFYEVLMSYVNFNAPPLFDGGLELD